jgi:hypothetical protein
VVVVAGSELSVGWVLGLSTHGFSFGVRGVVYCESAASESSQRFGAQRPNSTRQVATNRFALVIEHNNVSLKVKDREKGKPLQFVVIYEVDTLEMTIVCGLEEV